MPDITIRLLPYLVADGANNMAADETLLESAGRGVASLRFYGWSQATLSLGYFQPALVRQSAEGLAGLPFVRRPSGGATLVHHYEVTYALALPAGAPWQTGEPWLPRMHGIIAAALARLGVEARVQDSTAELPHAGPLCFKVFSPGDLLIGQAKIAGSAQRRLRGALLQHGAVLLARSPHAPALPGILDLTGRRFTSEELCSAVGHAFMQQTGWTLVDAPWTSPEQERVQQLIADKYNRDSWNCKR